MRVSALIVAALALLAAGLCVRLGFWQLSRWHEKRALETTRRTALAAPPIVLDGASLPPGRAIEGRMIELAGAWDMMHVVLLTGRTHDDAPGVELARPLRVAHGTVMVQRGWLPAEDGVHTTIHDARGADTLRVRGVAEPLRRGAGGWAPEPLPGSPGVFTARWLDADSLAAVLPGPIADWSLRELPSPGAPRLPLRLAPEPIDPTMHLSYAIQWFVFATAFSAGAWQTLRRGRRMAATP